MLSPDDFGFVSGVLPFQWCQRQFSLGMDFLMHELEDHASRSTGVLVPQHDFGFVVFSSAWFFWCRKGDHFRI